MFTQPCLLRNARKELVIDVIKLGYEPDYYIWRNNIEGSNLVLEHQQWHYTDSDNKPHCIDCGENESLFLAIAALRDDTDKDQWFVLETNLSSLDNPSKISHEIGSLVKCNRDKWFIDIDSNGKPLSVSSRNIPAHKATVEELIKHFK